ncbi:hypothetical protein CPB84DRAFT_1817663 [Gymnopilus junonius]|uniref:Uncharacterized protein n=1 Tax=Gymnopilus junonius TaxID=109634 RepID=A0A9P5NBY7_GYMJU|nr:hypothetical protein CPB84DRAFT_1817663 [Gymnopilus junonius]
MAKILLGCLVSLMAQQGIKAVKALLDFIYLAQYTSHNKETLDYMKNALEEFHDNKQYFINIQCQEHLNLPKLHSLIHYVDSIELFGMTNNYNTEMFEHLHIDFAKHDEFPQMIRCILTILDVPSLLSSNMFRFCPEALQDGEEEKDIVKAVPRSKGFPHGRFDTVIVLATDEAESHGLTGTRIGRVKVIFSLPDKLPAPGQPISVPASWPKMPLAYVEWYTCQPPLANSTHGMYQISKSKPDKDGRRPGEVIPLSSIRQSCMLFPVFREAPDEKYWKPSNVLDKAEKFLINNWLSKYSYQTLW